MERKARQQPRPKDTREDNHLSKGVHNASSNVDFAVVAPNKQSTPTRTKSKTKPKTKTKTEKENQDQPEAKTTPRPKPRHKATQKRKHRRENKYRNQDQKRVGRGVRGLCAHHPSPQPP